LFFKHHFFLRNCKNLFLWIFMLAWCLKFEKSHFSDFIFFFNLPLGRVSCHTNFGPIVNAVLTFLGSRQTSWIYICDMFSFDVWGNGMNKYGLIIYRLKGWYFIYCLIHYLYVWGSSYICIYPTWQTLPNLWGHFYT